METREFQEQDWNGFCGATEWDDGNAPLFAKGNFADGREYVMILDATGGCLLVEGDDDANDEGGRVLECAFPTQAAAWAFARGIGEPCNGPGPCDAPGPLEVADFLALGFC